VAVGNDVVDLTDPETDLRTLHPRFAERVFSPAERHALAACEREPVARRHGSTAREAPARTLLHWALWAAKESAYKALRRLAPDTVFSPREFEVDLPSPPLLAATGAIEGSVIHRGRRFSLRVHRDGARLHAIVGSADLAGQAILSKVGAAARDPSADARRLAVHELSSTLGLDPLDLQIVGRPPTATYRGRPLCAELSLSHHGQFVAFACALPTAHASRP
jgi:phosphopantetheinyl transferase (holo-ACP synthase)